MTDHPGLLRHRSLIFAALLWLTSLCAPSFVRAQAPPILEALPPNAVAGQTFTSILAVRELSDGRLLLTDRVERSLVLLDLDQGSVTQIGRRGQGPGEYGVPTRIAPLTGDSSIVIDGANRRWLILDGPEFVDTWGVQRVPTETVGMEFQGIVGGERIVGLRTHRYSALEGMPGLALAPHNADSVAVLMMAGHWREEPGARLDTLAVIAGPGNRSFCMSTFRDGAPGGAQIGGCSPVSGGDLVVPYPDGWIAILHHAPYRVAWRTPTGAWIQGRPLPSALRSLSSPEEQCLALRLYPFRGGVGEPCSRGELAGRDFPPHVPPFLRLSTLRMAGPGTPGAFATPEGRLVVRRTPELRVQENRYDLINREGTLEAVLSLPANEAIVGFGPSSVYVVETDEVELQTLRRHPWPWGSR